jgi:hypothetical protein
MATAQSMHSHDHRNPIARDINGNEHEMMVVERAGLICISDDAMERVMPERDALELAWTIIQQVTHWRRPLVGPLSSTF